MDQCSAAAAIGTVLSSSIFDSEAGVRCRTQHVQDGKQASPTSTCFARWNEASERYGPMTYRRPYDGKAPEKKANYQFEDACTEQTARLSRMEETCLQDEECFDNENDLQAAPDHPKRQKSGSCMRREPSWHGTMDRFRCHLVAHIGIWQVCAK